MKDFPVTGSVSTEGCVDILCFYICFIFPAFFFVFQKYRRRQIYSVFRAENSMIYVIEHLVMGSASHHETYIFNAKCHQLNVYDTEEQEQLVPWMFSLCLHFGARL